MTKTILEIGASAEDTWEIFGRDFVNVQNWMAAIVRAEPISKGTQVSGAPAIGRNSYLMSKQNGIYQREVLVDYDDAKKYLAVDVTLMNTPFVNPLIGYSVKAWIEPITETTCRIVWDGEPRRKLIAKFIPGTKGMLNPGFLRGVEELKHYVETGEWHPRKVKNMEEEQAYLTKAA